MSEAQPTAAIDRTQRAGSPGLVLALSVLIILAVVAFYMLPADNSRLLATVLLALLSVAALLAMFAYAMGFLQFAGQAARNDITRLMADSSADGYLVTEGENRVIYANETYLALSGARSAEDVRIVDRLFSGAPEVSDAVYRLAQAGRDGKRANEEVRVTPALNGEGEAAWYRVRVRPLASASKKRTTFWTVSDVTRERERHETAFQELQHAIDFLDHAPAGFFSATPDGSISYINSTLAGWLDYDLAQVGSGGLKLSDIVAGGGAAMLSAMPGKAGEVKTGQFDIDFKCRDGKNLPVRLLHRLAFSADRKPGPSRTLVINRAAGEEPAEDLRAAQVRFARFFHQTPMAIAAVEATGRITNSNAAFARLAPDALKGTETSFYAALVERDRPAAKAALEAAAQGHGDIPPLDVALEGEAKKLARLFISTADPGEAGGATATVFALDITEQRTLQDNFAQSQKMQAIGQLAGGIAHDFNNVLTAIIGYSDLLLANHRPTDPSFQDIMNIKQNANRAAGLVRQLLAFSRRQTLRPQVLQLGDVMSDLQMLLRRLTGERTELDIRHGRDLWLVRADINQFEQVLVNLVVNARDAISERGGKVQIRTRNVSAAECEAFNEKSLTPANYVVIEVEDNGHGIPPDVKEKIFEPFFTTKEVGKGTGLGLSMVYGIVKQTGGFVFCDSEVGKGTVFRIFLPQHVLAENEEVAKKEIAKPSGDLTGHGRILLVEDEEAVRAFGARALTSRGYTVLQAASGLEALEVVEGETEKIDLIVSDVVMPEMDGPTMFAELRRRGITAKVIFVSGYAEEAFSKNLPEGDFAFLPKPFSLKQLVEAVKANLA